MSEEILDRLTELARKAYDNRDLSAAYGDWKDGDPGVEVIDDCETELHISIKAHPRAVEAMEAALLVLSSKPRDASDPCALVHRKLFPTYNQLLEECCAKEARLIEQERELAALVEVCICAAIRLPDGRIIYGHRHHDALRTAQILIDHRHSIDLEPAAWSCDMGNDQGFVTTRGRYVDREEGLRLQLAAGISSACHTGYRARDLFSEDLYTSEAPRGR
jgi:hypothetical protein